jgi:hypothetical protein
MWTTGRDEPEVTNQSERVRTPTLESTDLKVGGSSPSERATQTAGQRQTPESVHATPSSMPATPAPCPGPAIGLRPDLALIDPGYATRSEKARVTAAVRLETSSLS